MGFSDINVFVSPTHDSKVTGDEGLYAAIEAARLARALHGATIRPHVRGNPGINPNSIPLAEPPKKWVVPSLGECAEYEVMMAAVGGDKAVMQYREQVAVAIPDDGYLEELRAVVSYIHHVKPHPVMNFDDVKRLIHLMDLPGANVTCLNFGDGAIMPHNHTDAIPATVMARIEDLKMRFPLPTPKPKKIVDDDDDEEEVEDDVDLNTNEELKVWCQSQQLEYTNYDDALRLRAAYELDTFRNICSFLMQDKKVRVVLLDHNQLGMPNEEDHLSLVPLRLLAKVIDANETIKVLDLSSNELGPHGFGIICKAMTKNISIVALDLANNQLGMQVPELDEDPDHTEEDPVFGETYNGLEAISEVLKKNKFLRSLRLAHNQIHSGAEGEEPPTVNPAEMDPEQDAATPDVESWQDLPLWRLVAPLREYHRLTALDLTGNELGPEGARMVATALADNHSLQVLNLTANNIGFRGLHYIAKLLLPSKHSVLHTLILRRNELAGKKTSRSQQKMALAAMEAVALALENNNRLRRLSVAGNYLGPILCSALLRTIGTASALEELDLESNDACGEVSAAHDTTALRFIAAALYGTALCGRRPSLAVLRLGSNNIQSAGMQVLFPFPASMPTSLREVDLSRNNIYNDLDSVNHLLISSPILHRLVLAFNGITAAPALLHGIAANTGLAELDLSHNKLGSLKEQYCSDPTAQVTGVADLLQVLVKHPSLENIDLSYNEFHAIHGQLLAELCNENNTHQKLRRLDLSGNPEINQHDVEQMVRSLANKTGMEAFYISTPYPARASSSGAIRPVGQDAAAESFEEGQQQESLLKVLWETVKQSPSLIDINCDLQKRIIPEEDSQTVEGELIGEMRRRLLLNTILAQAKDSTM
ncbi:Leucine-rich repeat [Trypanosoma melophagium]|uniref:Leucine-rich repeat n=1 Tax=Trypanosoma melophagium TaxID=715481 RepID=UPI00351A915A|nr:Leucine-rich repeat [Trypanosoma melophagium]